MSVCQVPQCSETVSYRLKKCWAWDDRLEEVFSGGRLHNLSLLIMLTRKPARDEQLVTPGKFAAPTSKELNIGAM